MSDDAQTDTFPPLRHLTRAQRRVLGTMIEKGITVSESYPLTLKALTTGCNQKNNRDPITNFSEDDVLETLDELRELGLAAVVHTESGRTERYRHYLRRRMADLSEPQVAVLSELLLRGRQSAGDLRSRASRMAPAGSLDSQDQLRTELTGLLEKGLIQSDGPLDRRGVEIDHHLYEPGESRTMTPRAVEDIPPSPRPAPSTASAVASPVSAPVRATASATASPDLTARIAGLESTCAALRNENQELRSELSELREQLDRLTSDVQKFRDALGG